MLDDITPLILTYNEAPNIARTLQPLGWAKDVIVVDSMSSDNTLDIVRSFPNTRIVQRPFDSFEGQWNHALTAASIRTSWVLALDADYVLTSELVDELRGLRPAADVTGYRMRFRYCVDGKVLRGSLYPSSLVLFRRDAARIRQDGHAYRTHLESGREGELEGYVLHDDRKPLLRWLHSQERYAAEEAHKLSRLSLSELRWPDRVRKVPLLAAPLVGMHCLIGKGCLLDGKAGLKYAAQRTIAELIISLKLLDANRDTSRGPDT